MFPPSGVQIQRKATITQWFLLFHPLLSWSRKSTHSHRHRLKESNARHRSDTRVLCTLPIFVYLFVYLCVWQGGKHRSELERIATGYISLPVMYGKLPTNAAVIYVHSGPSLEDLWQSWEQWHSAAMLRHFSDKVRRGRTRPLRHQQRWRVTSEPVWNRNTGNYSIYRYQIS